MDFISYGLLKYIIDQFGSNTLKIMMDSYSCEVVNFMKNTTVKQLMDYWSAEHEQPPNFSKLKAKIDEDPAEYTLYQLDQLRKHYCSEMKLTEVVFMIIGVKVANSFTVEWLFPSTLVPLLVEATKGIDFAFFLRERILKIAVDEKQIFPFIPDSKSKVSTLQAAAATVTVICIGEYTYIYTHTHTLYSDMLNQKIMKVYHMVLCSFSLREGWVWLAVNLVMNLYISLVPRPLPAFQCCTLKRERAWYLNSCV